MALKKTLLEIVQEILEAMDSEDVNSISDSVESLQVAGFVQTAYENIIATRDIPEHHELIKLTAASNSSYPTHFQYNTNVKEIEDVWYQDADGYYREVCWKDPLDFLLHTDTFQGNYDSVADQQAGTTLRIKNDARPTFYTSFDDEWIVMNSYDSSVEATLQESKVRAYGVVYPVFNKSDSYVPDIDATLFPYLIGEAKSLSMSLLKGGSDPKVEQFTRRQKAYKQNDMYRTKRGNTRPNYGRK